MKYQDKNSNAITYCFGPNINELVLFQVEQILWEVSDEVRASRLRSFKNQFFTYQNPRIRIQLRFHNFLAPITSWFRSRLSKFCGKSQTKFGHRVYADSSFLEKSKATLNRRNSGAKSPRPLPKMTRYFFSFGLRQASVASMAFYGPAEQGLFKAFFFLLAQLSVPFLYFFLSRVFCIEKKEKKWKKGSNQHLYMNSLQKFWFLSLCNV